MFYRVLVAAVPVSLAAFSFTRSHRVHAEENKSVHNFNVVIVGAGTAGLAVANQLKRSKDVTMAIVDPSTTHYYQPGWTLFAAGLIQWDKIVSVTEKYVPKGAKWFQTNASSFDPSKNTVTLADGTTLRYHYMVVATGVTCDYDRVEGLRSALDEDRLNEKGVCSIYDKDYVQGVYRKMDALTNDDVAIFTQPPCAIKCGGAPFKIMALTQDHTFRRNLHPSISFVIPQTAIFGIPFVRPILEEICQKRKIGVLLGEELVSVRGKERVAVFKKLSDGTLLERKYDMLHVVPHMGPPLAVSKSSLANAAGFVDVDKGTCQHVRYPNVFSLGDCSSLPCSKTAAAICAQAPVVVHNILTLMNGRRPNAIYDGYASCPIITGKNKGVLAEFRYGGEPADTFAKFPMNWLVDQRKEGFLCYALKRYVFPVVYWQQLHGRWYGPRHFRVPTYPESIEHSDHF